MATPSKSKPKRPWQDVAREAREYRDVSIAAATADFPAALDGDSFLNLPRNSSNIPIIVLHPRDVRITETLPEELIRGLATEELSATDVTTAFLRQAAVAQKLVC